VRDVLGDEFCFWAKVPSCIYLTGSTIWSCQMAVYRLLVRPPSRPVNMSFIFTSKIVPD
jgi:hypothetical protein